MGRVSHAWIPVWGGNGFRGECLKRGQMEPQTDTHPWKLVFDKFPEFLPLCLPGRQGCRWKPVPIRIPLLQRQSFQSTFPKKLEICRAWFPFLMQDSPPQDAFPDCQCQLPSFEYARGCRREVRIEPAEEGPLWLEWLGSKQLGFERRDLRRGVSRLSSPCVSHRPGDERRELLPQAARDFFEQWFDLLRGFGQWRKTYKSFSWIDIECMFAKPWSPRRPWNGVERSGHTVCHRPWRGPETSLS